MTRSVLGVVGSLRTDSYNGRLLRWMARRAPEELRVEVVADALRLPLFDEDLETDGFPPAVEAGHRAIAASDGLILATPEYNFGVPGPVKNWLDWMSRPPRRSALAGKPVLLVGASTGRTGGTVQAQGQLRVSLAVLGAQVVAHPPVLIAEAATRFDGDEVTDPLTGTVVDLALTRFIELIERCRHD